MNNTIKTGSVQEAAETDPFGFSLENLHVAAVERLDNPQIRNSILRVKHGKSEQGFTHRYDRAYHSHTSS